MHTETLEEMRARIERSKMGDKFFVILSIALLLISLVILLALVGQLVVEGLPKLSWRFLTSPPSSEPGEAGILVSLVGSVLVILVTAFAAIPTGIAAGTYLEEYAPKNFFTDFIEVNIANLAGVPSIVYGLLALSIFVYGLRLGESVLTAGLTLALLILPVIIVTTREAIKSIPVSIREAAFAMGASKWQTTWDHVIPYSLGGIMTGIIVGLSRAIGESAPLVTIGALTFITFLPDPPLKAQFPFVSFQWLLSPFTVLPIQMFDWVSRPQAEFKVNAAATGIILLVVTLVMNAVAVYVRYYFRKRVKW